MRGSRTPRWSWTKRSSCSPRATTRWKRAARWPIGRTASCTCTARRRACPQTVPAIARWVGIEPTDVVLISEYTGGGFGSKGGGAVSMAIPALLSKKANAPVMMRISREEESYIGRARTNMSGRVKVGFAKDGRITALDLYHRAGQRRRTGRWATIAPPATAASIIYQPAAMRWRAVSVLTNTPPRTQQRSPGPMQANGIIEPVITKAAKQLGVDQVAIRRINSPEGKAMYGPPAEPNGQRARTHERVRRTRRSIAAARCSSGTTKKALLGPASRLEGARRRRRGRPARVGLDWLGRPDDDSPRRQALRAVGRRQSGHALVHRSRPRRRRRARNAVGEGRGHLGRHGQGPAVDMPLGRQPDDACDDARQLTRGRWTRSASCRRSRRGISAARQTTTSSATSASIGVAIPPPGMSYAQAAKRAIELGGKLRRPRGSRRHQRDDQACGRHARGSRPDGRRQGQLPARRRPRIPSWSDSRKSKWTSRPAR